MKYDSRQLYFLFPASQVSPPRPRMQAPHWSGRLACIWSRMTIHFNVMESGTLVVIQLQVHARRLSIQTKHALLLPIELAKYKKLPGSNRRLYLLYMANKSYWINVGKIKKHIRFRRARASQPPEKSTFQVREISNAYAGLCMKEICILSSAAYEC